MPFNQSDPNSFLNNFNNASVEYSTDLDTDQQRLSDLQAAYQYLQNNATQEDKDNYAGYSQYMMSQLQADIQEQQNLVQTAQAQGGVANQTNNLSGIEDVVQQLSKASNQGADTSSWGIIHQYTPQIIQYIQQNPGQFANQPGGAQGVIYLLQGGEGTQNNPPLTNQQLQSILTGYQTQVQNQINTLTTGLSSDQANVIQDFVLNSPDYNHALQQVQSYLYGTGPNDQNAWVTQQTQAANESIYDQVYNIKNGINMQAAQMGAGNSGERQSANANATGQGIAAATQAAQSIQNQAQTAIQNEQQDIQNQKSQQQDITNQVQGGNIANLFDQATQGQINAYNAQTGTQNQENELANENNLNTAEENSKMWNDIFGTVGSAAGTVAGTAI